MDYLQYLNGEDFTTTETEVLNLVINGLPSIHQSSNASVKSIVSCFKPCYKWITFNTENTETFSTSYFGGF